MEGNLMIPSIKVLHRDSPSRAFDKKKKKSSRDSTAAVAGIYSPAPAGSPPRFHLGSRKMEGKRRLTSTACRAIT